MGKEEQQAERNEMCGGVKAKISPPCSTCECITLECDRDERTGEAGPSLKDLASVPMSSDLTPKNNERWIQGSDLGFIPVR